MKRIAIILGSLVAASILVLVCFAFGIGFLFHVSEPGQPKFGYTGDWRLPDVLGTEERPLPPAKEVWKDYASWTPKTQNRRRLYLARLGGAHRQTGFSTSMGSGDTPMGAQRYTRVEFFYRDPTNGVYALSWDLRGKHDTSFLRFDTNSRLYQLQPYGNAEDDPPKLAVIGIEGIKPGGP